MDGGSLRSASSDDVLRVFVTQKFVAKVLGYIFPQAQVQGIDTSLISSIPEEVSY